MENLIRGTTPGIEFDFEEATVIEFSQIADAVLTINADGENVITKFLADLEVNPTDKTISYFFSQEQSLALSVYDSVHIEFDILVNGKRLRAATIDTEVDNTNYNEVL